MGISYQLTLAWVVLVALSVALFDLALAVGDKTVVLGDTQLYLAVPRGEVAVH